MRRTFLLGAAALLAATTIAAAGCTASTKHAGSAAAGGSATAAGNAGASGAAGPPASVAAASGAASAPDRSLVETARQTVRVTDVNARADQAIRIATAARGGVLADRRSGSGPTATAELILQVLPGLLESSLDRLAALGDQVDRATSSQDVTQQVVDVAARLTSMRASLDRVRSLYARANSIGDVIKLESELAGRQADLESLEAQQQDLARQTARATIDLRLLAERAPAPVAAHHSASVPGGFVRGWHAFTTFLRWAVIVLGSVLPFLLVAGAAGGVALWLHRRHRAAAPPASPPAEG